MFKINNLYLNKRRNYVRMIIRYRNLQKYINNKLNEMKTVSEHEINNKVEKAEKAEKVEKVKKVENEDEEYEKIGLNSILHLLINNIKDDFKDEILETVENTKNMKDKNIKNNDKILVVISCHTDNSLRLKSIELIMYYLKEVKNIDIVIVNSRGLLLSTKLRERYKNDYFKYYEIKNDEYYGFSKWYYGLIQNEFGNYKYITFMNDSILIHQPIKHFFEYTRFKNVDFFGYNDSSQIKHHYQSYFFSVKTTAIVNFLKLFDDKKRLVRCYSDAVQHFELGLFDYFSNRDCFLNLAHLPLHRGKNIFFENDFLYFNLRKHGLLPFTKLKRIKPN